MEKYAEITAKILEILPPQMLILRLTADCPSALLVAPDWCNQKREILAAIEKELETRGSFQGSLYAESLTETAHTAS
jgi:radical SAM superfamily enzyme